ncbi:hypothetical protein [Spongiibacter sp.]|uniref:hypothetical protein n=1 Tax=Spongiibacter sp. TaxID=2024860 RepID=UPI00356AC8DD
MTGAGEPLQARGEYRYYKNGQLQPIAESWRQGGDAAGERWLESERCIDSGLIIASRANLRGNLVSRVSLSWRAASCVIEAHYDRERGLCQWQLAGGESQSMAIPPAVPLYPLMRIYTGAVIKELAELGGEADIVIPDIRPQTAEREKLQPLLSRRRCQYLGTADIDLQGRVRRAEKWRFSGDQYRAGSEFLLSDSGRLLRYDWQQDAQSQWRVELVEQPLAAD